MGPRSEQLAHLIASAGDPDVGFRQGTIIDWDIASGTNTVSFGFAQLHDLPSLNTNGQVILYPGDVVVLQRVRSQFFILGRIDTVNHQRMNVVVPGTMGATGDNWTANAPGTTSTSYVQLWTGFVIRGTANISFNFQTWVGATTGQYSFHVNGVERVNSGSFANGAGFWQGNVSYPDAVPYNFGCDVELFAKVNSGTGRVAAVCRGLYAT